MWCSRSYGYGGSIQGLSRIAQCQMISTDLGQCWCSRVVCSWWLQSPWLVATRWRTAPLSQNVFGLFIDLRAAERV